MNEALDLFFAREIKRNSQLQLHINMYRETVTRLWTDVKVDKMIRQETRAKTR